jgi:dTDP-4-dehydrorhamnose reductase
MILITGASGQLGQCFQQLALHYPQWSFIYTDAPELDITDAGAVDAFFKQHKPRWCINCAAYTAVDKAETDQVLAAKINVTGARYLANAAHKYGTRMVHFSTDYVYHNRQNTPFKEGDVESPKGVYARTKLQGDRAVLKASPEAMVIRTSWVYAPVGHNFVKTMMHLGKQRPSLSVVFDQIGTPTYAPDLAAAVLNIMTQVEAAPTQNIGGVWHYSNEGVTSWYDFACAVFELTGIDCKVLPIETSAYPTPARRPPFSVLNKGKIKAAFNLDIPHWRDSLKACLKALVPGE